MFKLQADLQDLLWHKRLKCRWLGGRATDPEWIAFVTGHRMGDIGMGRLSAQMVMVDTPFVKTTGLRVCSTLAQAIANSRAVEVFVFPAGRNYVVNLLRVTDGPGRRKFRSLLRPQGRKQFRFADLGAAMRMALRIINTVDEAGIARVLRRTEREMTAAQEG